MARDVWRLLASASRVLIPGTLVASLFYYFGLRYTDDHYRQYGLDDAAMGFSVTEYIVRSLNVTVEPIRLVALVLLAAVCVHVGIVSGLGLVERRRPTASSTVATTIGLLIAAGGLVAVVGFWSHGRFATDRVIVTAGWLAGACLVTYGVYLSFVRAAPRRRTSAVGAAVRGHERRVVVSLVVALLVVLTTHGAFEFTRAYARDRAYREALRTESAPWNFPQVRVYSTYDLALDDQLAVTETALTGHLPGYRFRYDGLRLFLQHDGRLLLWPVHRSPRAGMFILVESADIRVEYLPQRRG